MIPVLAQCPVDQHDMDRGIRGDDGLAVLGGGCFDHFDRAAFQFLHQRACGPAFSRRCPELVIHHECAQVQSLDASLDHFIYS